MFVNWIGMSVYVLFAIFEQIHCTACKFVIICRRNTEMNFIHVEMNFYIALQGFLRV